MTICVPPRPFEILGIGLGYVFLFSWIPLIGYSIWQCSIGHVSNCLWGIFAIIPLIFWLWWFNDYNNEHHLIQWCDKTSNDKTSNSSMEKSE